MAQPKSYSPVSRIGLGNIRGYGLPVQQSMGGYSAAYQSAVFPNVINPASLSWLRTTALDVGMFAENNSINSEGKTFRYWTGNISHLVLAFPIFNPVNDLLNRKERDYAWGMMLGLMPFSEVGYDIVTDIEDPELGLLRTQYTGTGGSYALMWGNGVRYKNSSIGFRAEYIFGDLQENRVVDFSDVANTFRTIYSDDINVGVLRWNFGFQQKFVLQYNEKPDGSRGSEEQTITLGIGLQSRSNMRFRETNYYRAVHSVYSITDTLLFQENNETTGVLPGEFYAGIQFTSKDKLKVGLDYQYGFWEAYESDVKPATMRNSSRFGAGVGYTPDARDVDSYFNRMTYRAGFYYRTDPRVVNDVQMEEYGISFGLTLPFIGQRRSSYGNFSFIFGERDVPGVISESFFSIKFGFTATDNNWFVKPKFN